MEDFIHLHVHTHYSLLDGMSKVPDIVDKAIADGMKGIALTDHGNMFGMKELFDYCNKVNGKRKKEGLEPFKPIFGCEMYVARRNKEDMTEKIDRSGNHLIVLAKNANGYRNLIKLVSRAWVDGNYIRPRTDKKDLKEFHEDLIICSACIAGEPQEYIRRALRLEKYAATETRSPEELFQMADDAVRWYKEVFGDDYYMELMRHEVTDPTISANRETYPVQKAVEPYLIELAKKYDVKLICSNDAHFLNKDDADAHEILLCLSTGKKLTDPHMQYSKQEWLKTREEMNEIFSDIPEALSNTIEILDKVETYDLDSAPIMPFYPIPEDFGTEEEWRKMFSEEDLYREFTTDEYGENALPEEDGKKKISRLGGYEKLYRIKFEADFLGKLAYEGASRLYGSGYQVIDGKALQANDLSKWAEEHDIRKEVDERIRFELHIMKTMGFPGYFLIVQDFINSAREELGVWVGPGRGSAAGSVVAYCLGITKLDPLKYDLLFERFLNPDRISLPDIDTDFDDDGRGKVLQWVMEKYGRENCAHIITYGSMAAKNSIKDVARVEDIPLPVVNGWCKAMPDRLPDGMKPKLPNYLKCTPELQEAQASNNPDERDTIKHALKLEGTVRGSGIHACGFIICRDPIDEHVPVSTADDPDFPDIKTAVTQYDGHVIESTGLIKMDFLGLKTLSEQKECVKNIKLTRGIDVDLDTIPIDDAKTYELYQKGQTVGTFQFESAGMQKYLRELHPTVFEDLIAMNALYRPGPMDYIPSFIARKNGREPITYDIDCMEKYLKDTYGITVYQEQVMLLSRQLADFTRGQSDALRKAMGKKKKDIVDQMKPMFIEGGKKNGHDEKILEKIWADWEKFASYAFNKSHAACYSWVAYQTAYLKANYPEEFMAALLTRRRSDIKEVTKLLDECRALGIVVKGPSVNESRQTFTVAPDKSVRFGFAAISGIGDGAADEIVNEREKNGPFQDIFDFVKRINFSNVNSKCVENLINSGSFDCFGLPREQYSALNAKGEPFFKQLISFGQLYQAEKQQSANSLFGGFEEVDIPNPKFPPYEEIGHIQKLNIEKSLIGLYLSAHPLDEYKAILTSYCNTRVTELDDTKALEIREEIRCGGIVTEIKRQGFTSKGNNPFGIVVIEDYSGSHELFLIGDTWTSNSGILTVGSTVYIKGKMEPKFRFSKELAFRPSEIRQLGQVQDERLEGIKITLNSDEVDMVDVNELLEIVKGNSENGEKTLSLELHTKDTTRPLTLQSGKLKINVTQKLIDKINSLGSFECTALWQ